MVRTETLPNRCMWEGIRQGTLELRRDGRRADHKGLDRAEVVLLHLRVLRKGGISQWQNDMTSGRP